VTDGDDQEDEEDEDDAHLAGSIDAPDEYGDGVPEDEVDEDEDVDDMEEEGDDAELQEGINGGAGDNGGAGGGEGGGGFLSALATLRHGGMGLLRAQPASEKAVEEGIEATE